jgi:nitric oxide dioxygenase
VSRSAISTTSSPTWRISARHTEYGAQPDHYPVVGEVLIGAMAEVGGDAWKPEYTAAWQEAYGVVQNVMLAGAAAAR